MTNFYADYITKTTFDPETNSVRSKLVEERGAPSSECCDAPLKNYNNGTGICHECGEHAGPTPEEHKEESMLGMRGSEKLNGGKSKDPRFKSSASHIDYHHRRAGGHELPGGDADSHRYKTAKKLGYQVEAATDMKKKPASKTPKVEVDATEIPEAKMRKCPETGKMIPVDEKLHGDQHKLDHNKDMKITSSDMKMVRKKGAVKNHPMEAEENPPMIIKSKKSVSNLRRSAASRPKGVAEDQLEEGSFKVQVDGLPTMYIDGSAGEIKASLRKKFKDPKAVISVERITPAEKKKELRAKVAEDQAAMDAYLKKGGTVKKLPAAHARSTTDMEKDVKGRVDTSTLKTRGKVKSMEDVEQVDEISKRAKAAYTRVAARDLHHQGSKAAQGVANNDREAIKKADRNINNRLQGIDRATKSLQKEGAMKRMATQDAEKERLGPRKVKGDGMDTFKKKPMGEKFAHAAQQAAVMAKLKASGKYKKPKESVEEQEMAHSSKGIAAAHKAGLKINHIGNTDHDSGNTKGSDKHSSPDITVHYERGDQPHRDGSSGVTLHTAAAKKHSSHFPKHVEEEKDTHVTKDGKTAKKGLWYNIHKKRARGEAPAKPGDPDRPSAADLKRSQ